MTDNQAALRLADDLIDAFSGQGLCACAAAELRRLHDECEALKADAARYRWLRDNLRRWSWNPDGHVYPDKVVGFAHKGTGYLDSEFQTAIDAARGKV